MLARAAQTDLPIHPAAEIFPLMTGAEFDALVADIKEHGQCEPIVLCDGAILDGRNRYRACQQLGLRPRLDEWHGNGSPEAFVVSHNLHRRHLNGSQRAIIAARLTTQNKGQRADLTRKNEDTENRHLPIVTQAEAGSLLNIGTTAVSDAKIVLEQAAPEEIAAVEAGRVSVNKIVRQIRAEGSSKLREQRQSTGRKKVQQGHRVNSQVWAQIKAALVNLTALPAPEDVARIARGQDRTNLVNKKLKAALSWLKEFDNAWSNRDEAD